MTLEGTGIPSRVAPGIPWAWPPDRAQEGGKLLTSASLPLTSLPTPEAGSSKPGSGPLGCPIGPSKKTLLLVSKEASPRLSIQKYGQQDPREGFGLWERAVTGRSGGPLSWLPPELGRRPLSCRARCRLASAGHWKAQARPWRRRVQFLALEAWGGEGGGGRGPCAHLVLPSLEVGTCRWLPW